MPLNDVFHTVLAASWQGTVVILLVLLLRPCLGLSVPARWRSLLWSLVLLRLLVPASVLPASRTSFQNLPVVNQPWEQARRTFAPPRSGADVALVPRNQGPSGNEAADLPVESPLLSPTHTSAWRLASLLWLAGTVVAGLWLLAATCNLHLCLWREAGPAWEEVQAQWVDCCARLGLARPPRLRATSLVETPALVGVFRPALLIPRAAQQTYSAEDWEHVFLHELAHCQWRDHWTQALQLLALCAHWFNPLVWLGFRYLRADRELAADEWALRHLTPGRSAAYGGTLLKVLTQQPHPVRTACTVGILEDSTQMRQRLRRIVAFTPRRLVGSMAGLGFALALAAVVLGKPVADLAAYDGLSPQEALVIAARHGDEEAVGRLLDEGADINGVCGLRGERTALTSAVAFKAEGVLRLLLARGAEVNRSAEKGDSPILVALKKGWGATAEELHTRGAVCEAEMWAAAQGDLKAVQAYLAPGTASYERVKLLAEVAAANGHRELFATLYDALEQFPERREYYPFSRGTFVTAILHNHRGVIEELLARDPNLLRGDGVNRLAAAAARTPGLRAWLLAQGLQVPLYNDGERLISAAENEDLPELRRLLAAGADVNYRGESDWTPLSKAATWGNPRAVRLLLEKKAKPNPSKHSYSTLGLAKTPEIAELLVAAGARVQPVDIEYPAGTGSIEMTKWFLDHGTALAGRPDRGTALLLDAWNPEMVRFLVSRGARIQAGDPAALAALLPKAPTAEAVELILAAGADVNARDRQGFTPLIQTLMHGWPTPARQVSVLLKHGADPNSYTPEHRTALMFARDGATVDALVAAGADLYAISDQGEMVVQSFKTSTSKQRSAALAKYGLRDDALMETYRRAGAHIGRLSFAAGQGDLEQMRALVAAGATIDESSQNGYTPLRFAVDCGQAAAVEWLLAHGANVNRFDAYGLSVANAFRVSGNYPISGLSEEASTAARTSIAALLQGQRLDPGFRNEAGETALLRAAGSRSFSFEAALSTDRDLNAQRHDGMTALMLAVTSPPPKDGSTSQATVEEPGRGKVTYSLQAYIVRTLLRHGADCTLRNQAGQTALDLARLDGSEELLSLLEPEAH